MKITVEIPRQTIAHLMTYVVEGNAATREWCSGVYLEAYTKNPSRGPWYGEPFIYEDPRLKIEVHERIDGDEDVVRVITLADIQRGIELMAEKFPKCLCETLSGTFCAHTADTFWQCVVLKDVVYD